MIIDMILIVTLYIIVATFYRKIHQIKTIVIPNKSKSGNIVYFLILTFLITDANYIYIYIVIDDSSNISRSSSSSSSSRSRSRKNKHSVSSIYLASIVVFPRKMFMH